MLLSEFYNKLDYKGHWLIQVGKGALPFPIENLKDETLDGYVIERINVEKKQLEVREIHKHNLVKCSEYGCETPYDTLMACAECGDTFCQNHARERLELCYEDEDANGDYPVDSDGKYLCGKTVDEHELAQETLCDDCVDNMTR